MDIRTEFSKNFYKKEKIVDIYSEAGCEIERNA